MTIQERPAAEWTTNFQFLFAQG